MFTLSPLLRHKLKDVFLTVLLWVIATRVLVMTIYVGAGNSLMEFQLESKALTLLTRDLTNVSIAGFIIGLLTGISEIFIFPGMFRNKPAFKLFLAKMLVYLIAMSLATAITIYIYQCQYKGGTFNEYLDFMSKHFISTTFLTVTGFGLIISFGVNVILFIRNKLGAGIVIPIFMGRYHNPTEEDRIFIFIDLKSSVEIAEQLSPTEYSQFLQDCFLDLEEVVIKHKGQIYQYVGDECVITWKVKRNTDFNQPIRLFFEFRDKLETKSAYYETNYQTIPKFKGAIHSGVVSTAEIGGKLKSEIAFHGDVVNTTARVMELCKEFNEDLLMTESMLMRTNLVKDEFKIISKDYVALRGKHIKHKVCSIHDNHLNGSL